VNKANLVVKSILIIMLLWALNRNNSYEYYTLLHWVCCGVFSYLAFLFFKQKKQGWIWVLGITALFYNPIFPVHLNRELWSLVNVVTIIILIGTIVSEYRSKRNNGQGNIENNLSEVNSITKDENPELCGENVSAFKRDIDLPKESNHLPNVMNWLKNSLGKLLGTSCAVIIGLYFLSVMIFVPYYNWQYARSNGVIDWMFFGEIAATAKAIVWPYFEFVHKQDDVIVEKSKSNLNSNSSKSSSDESIFTTHESDAMGIIITKAYNEDLTESDLNSLKNIYLEHDKRKGTKIPKIYIDNIMNGMDLMAKYNCEYFTSMLISWDRKSKYTTPEFDQVFKIINDNGIMAPNRLSADMLGLEGAAKNLPYVEDDAGVKYDVRREIILEKLNKAKIMESNVKKMNQVLIDYSNS